MNFSGKYQVQTQENYEAFMKAVGECWAKAGDRGHEGLALQVVASQGPEVRQEEQFKLHTDLESRSAGSLCSFGLFLPGQDYALGKWKWH